MNPLGFMRSLSMGVAHKWDPKRVFVILTAYLDESGTSKRTVLAGYLGHAPDWAEFESKWGRMLKKYELPYFHAHEAYQRNGVCRGWQVEKCNRLFREAEHFSHQAAQFGVVSILNHADYEDHYKIKGKRQKGTAIPDSKYGLCFRMTMSMIGSFLQTRYSNKKNLTLHVIVESGNQNAGDLVRIFKLMKGPTSVPFFRSVLGTLSFASKSDCYPAQAADGLAYTANGLEEFPVEVVDHVPTTAWTGGREIARKHKKEVGGRSRRPIYRLVFNHEQLRDLRTHLFVKNPLPSFQFT